MLLLVVALLVLLFTYLFIKGTSKYDMFAEKGILEPWKRFPFGSWSNWQVMMGKLPFFKSLDEYYFKYGKNHKYLGIFSFGEPVLCILDLDSAKNILIKDFDHFADRRTFGIDMSKEENKILGNMLTTIKGEKWKKVRSIMSPAFTSGKLKHMTPLLSEVGNNFVDHLDGVAKSGKEVEAKETLISYFVDSIATVGFGVEANSFKDPNGRFLSMVMQATGNSKKGKTWRMAKMIIAMMMPKVAELTGISVLDGESILFLAEVVRTAVAHRRKEGVKRNDFIDLVLEALENSEKEVTEVEDDQFEKDAVVTSDYKIPKDEIELLLISNAVVLFFAGFDTSSTSISACIMLLAKNPDFQEKLFQEIDEAIQANGNQNLDYTQVQELPYLEMVFMETLRFYFVGNLERVCVQDYKLPDSDFVVPRGMLVQFPGNACHRNEEFYPDPHNFNPDENWSPEAKSNRTPYAFMSFGQGPRNCIGMRFALLMIKMALVKLVANYKILPGPSMPKEMLMDPMSTSASVLGGVWIKLERRIRE